MPSNNHEQSSLLAAWKDFIHGKANAFPLRPPVKESWNRCRLAAVDPYNKALHHRMDATSFSNLLNAKKDLITIAKPFMSNLYEFVRGSGFVVVLANEDGYIMDVFSDNHFNKSPLTNNFFQGSSWQEAEAGTNAIGTVAVIHAPVQISGAEHFCQKHHGLTCSAAPIFNSERQLIGILDISGASHMTHLHTLGMVVSAAEAIMAQLDVKRKNRELAFTNNRLTNIFNTISDGVLMVDIQGIITEINPAAKEILNNAAQDALGMPIEQLFGGKASLARRMLSHKEHFEDIELMVDAKKSMLHCYTSGKPLSDEQGQVLGGVITLRPVKQIQNLINRLSGYTAALQFDDIIGESTEIKETKRVASLAATTSLNILLQGESGTGKEIFAQAIHNHSDRQNGPFVAVNCGIIPRELIGSELFGYADGAFTGAKQGGKPGKFELASGGTLFLDEIGDMPLEQQVALLRVLEEKKLTRIGSSKVIPVNVRFICATNKNLLQQVESGAFRQDLYYRLNVISITLPPLRNRQKDLPLLVSHFLEKLGRDRGRKFTSTPELIEFLQYYDWPGNVRELQNIIERATSLSETDKISLSDLPAEIYTSQRTASYSVKQPLSRQPIDAAAVRQQHRQLMQENEKQRILAILAKHGGNVSAAARELGIARKTLYRKMQF